MDQNTSEAKKKPVVYGRPRLLTHEEIIEGAIALGLEGLTMKKLATHLNVGTATLYQYWGSRKELMQAAAVHSLSDLDLPEDTGQHWSEYAREYVNCILDLLAGNPTFVLSYHAKDYGFEVQFKLIEQFLSAMKDRGFEPEAGMRLFNMVGSAAFAGAVETIRQNEFELHNETMTVVAERQFGRLESDDFPLMQQAMKSFSSSPADKVESLLQAAFKTIARERGEPEEAISTPS